MAITQKYQVEELDHESRDYLLAIRDSQGEGMPGVYVAQSNWTAGCGLICGIIVLIVTVALSFNQIEKEPLAVAMLQTAGLLLGGWLVIYALRVWMTAKGKSNAGHFVYADAQTLWECSGSSVSVTDLSSLIEARQTINYNNDKYQNTAVEIETADGSRKFTLSHESGAKRLVIFLNLVAWLRSGGREDVGIPMPSEAQGTIASQPAATLGGIALEIYERSTFPTNWSADALQIDVDTVPTPTKENRASSSILWYLLIIGVAVGGVFLFKEWNIPERDKAIWKQINDIPQPEKRAPWIRAYLNDPRNTLHRDEAKQQLLNIYKDAIQRIKNQMNEPMNLDKPHPVLLEGLKQILEELPNQHHPLITIRVKENEKDSADATKVRDAYTLAILDGVGKELITFAEAPAEAPAMIEIDFVQKRLGDGRPEIEYKVAFRRTADADLAIKVTHSLVAINGVAESATLLGRLTAGKKKPEPPPVFVQ